MAQLPIRAITFDAGDTLIFDSPSMLERIALALDTCGVSFAPQQLTPAVRKMAFAALEAYTAGLAIDDPRVLHLCAFALLAQLNAPLDESTIALVVQKYADIKSERYIDKRMIDLIGTLRERGFKIGIISDWEPDFGELLHAFGFAGLFDAISISGVVGATKPRFKLFNDAITKLGMQPSEILHVGDYLELDVIGAGIARMQAILYDWKHYYDDRHVEVPVAHSFAELESLLLALPMS